MQVLELARAELERYFRQITGESADITLSVDASLAKNDSFFDDAFDIRVVGGKGEIVGLNPRSVLLGVYRYLYHIGCRFIAPGEGGEVVPRRTKAACDACEQWRPRVQQRAYCFEGSLSLENMLDIVDWMPKVGLNSAFVQFRDAHAFFERWYTHTLNPLTEHPAYTKEESAAHILTVEAEIAKRGLVYQKVGHGWTSECVGLNDGDWNRVDDALVSEEDRELLAMVGGARRLYGGIPLNTNLCYSNPKARMRFVDNVVRYASENPNVDIIHVWLADEAGNLCECEACQKATPTDWYVKLLNEIDARMTEQGLKTRLVFLLYFALLWPPVREKLQNPDRFIMMFAPITRTYARPLYEPDEEISTQPTKELPKHIVNREAFSDNVKENLEFLYHWKQHFAGESFDFDYHLMWDIFRELGGMKLAKVLCEDCRRITDIGFDGFMSVQQGRAGFPSSIGIYTLGKALFDPSLTFEEIADEFFKAAYGEQAELAKEYLTMLSDGFSYAYLRGKPEAGKSEAEYAAQFRATAERIRAMTPALLENDNKGRFWHVLARSAPILALTADALVLKAENADSALRREQLAKLRQAAWQAEPDIQKDFDALYFEYVVSRPLEWSIPQE